MTSEILSQKINQRKWHFWHIRHRSPFFSYIIYWGAVSRTLPQLPWAVSNNGTCHHHILTDQHELDVLGEKAWQAFLKTPDFLLRFMEVAYDKFSQDKKTWQTLQSMDFAALSMAELWTQYHRYVGSLLDYGPFIYIPLCLEEKLTVATKNYLSDRFENSAEKEAMVNTPIKESHVILERLSLLDLTQKYQAEKDFTALQTDTDQHVEEFSFLKDKGFFLDFFTHDYYKEQILNIKNPLAEYNSLVERLNKQKQDFRSLLDQIPDEYGQKLLETVNEGIFFRSWRSEKINHSAYFTLPLFLEIAKRLKLKNERDIVYLFPFEVEKSLLESVLVDVQEIEHRKQSFTYFTFEEQEHIFSGMQSQEFLKSFSLLDELVKEIIGTPAFEGKAQGKVVIVKEKIDYAKMLQGEILVVPSTLPDMVPFFKNIKAIVAEEGGILSHAAVISREMKIPSVIGAKNVTMLLKDGERVEVNAITGQVKKL